MQLSDYKHILPIQLRFSDIDRLNHVNNACYLNYFELARVNYFNDIFKDNINWAEKGFVLARTEIDYLESLILTDEVYCYTKVMSIGTKSITLKNIVIKKQGEQLIECANGIGVLVAMDYILQQSIEVPKKWVELINLFEA